MADTSDLQVGQDRPRRNIAAEWRARFHAETIAGIGFAFKARLAALGAIAVWVTMSLHDNALFPLYLGAVVVAAISGLIVYIARDTPWVASAHLLGLIIDMVIICGVLLVPPPGVPAGDWALHVWMRRGIFVYLVVYIALNALTYSPMMVLASGAVAVVGLIASYAWVVTTVDGGMDTLRRVVGVHLMSPAQFASNQMVLLSISCCVIAAAVWRARRHVMHSVEVERERANLARYFSPNLVDRLADADRSFEDGRVQTAAVLFVDIVGFTKLMEGEAPDRTVAMLRAFHKRMADTVFRHDGTLDKFIGDGLMATFGTPESRPDDAARALACSVAMIAVVADWNRQRQARGYPPVRIAVGVHLGPVMLGTIGSPERLEFTVMGDTVNVASRLERLNREQGAQVIVSDELLQAARQAGASGGLLDRFTRMGEVYIAGRQSPIGIWILPRDDAGPVARPMAALGD